MSDFRLNITDLTTINRVIVNLYRAAAPTTIIDTTGPLDPPHPERTITFSGLEPGANYLYRWMEIDGAGLSIQTYASQNFTVPSAGSIETKLPQQIIVGTTPGWTAAATTVVMDGTGGKADWRTWDIHLEKVGSGTQFTTSNYSWSKSTGTLTFVSGISGSYYVEFIPKVTNTPDVAYFGAYNVKWFGAKVDGIHDDASAINEALATNKYVFIPAGTALIGSDLIIKDGSYIFGEGSASIIKVNANGLTVLNALSISNIVIRDLAIDGGGQTEDIYSGKQGAIGLYLNNVHYFKVLNLTVYNCGVANVADTTDDGVIGGFGIIAESTAGETAYGTIDGCNIYRIAGGGMNRGDGIYIGGQNASASISTHHVSIDNCNVTTTGRHGYAVASGTDSQPHNIYFNNCTANKAALCGIDIEPGNSVYVDRCDFDYCGNDQYYYDPVSIPGYGAAYGLLAGISVTNTISNINISNVNFNNCYYGLTYGAVDGLTLYKVISKNSTVSDLYQHLASAPVNFTLTECKFLTPNTIPTFYYKSGMSKSYATNCVFACRVQTELADGFVFEKCTFKKGFYFVNPDQKLLKFLDCDFDDYAGVGIGFSSGTLKNITDVTVRDCRFNGAGNMTYGISFDFKNAHRWTVDDNHFEGQVTAGIFHTNASESNLFKSCRGNEFKDSANGILITQALLNSSITGNKFYNISGWCIKIFLVVSSEPPLTDLLLDGNTADEDCVNGLEIDVSTGTWDYCTIVNNNFRKCSGTKLSLSTGNANGVNANNLVV